MGDRLLFFMGDECDHCHEMEPLVERLEKEAGIVFTKLEVWHNSQNAKLLAELDTIDCGGIPFFYNEKTNEAICGPTSYENLREWALKNA
jgi:thiol-disulfide isomerase/thioredoxin